MLGAINALFMAYRVFGPHLQHKFNRAHDEARARMTAKAMNMEAGLIHFVESNIGYINGSTDAEVVKLREQRDRRRAFKDDERQARVRDRLAESAARQQ